MTERRQIKWVDFLHWLDEFLPNAEVAKDNTGQVVIYTGLGEQDGILEAL